MFPPKCKNSRLTHSWKASKGVIGEGHGPLEGVERGWGWSMDVEDRPAREVVLGVGVGVLGVLGWSSVVLAGGV